MACTTFLFLQNKLPQLNSLKQHTVTISPLLWVTSPGLARPDPLLGVSPSLKSARWSGLWFSPGVPFQARGRIHFFAWLSPFLALRPSLPVPIRDSCLLLALWGRRSCDYFRINICYMEHKEELLPGEGWQTRTYLLTPWVMGSGRRWPWLEEIGGAAAEMSLGQIFRLPIS